MNIFIPMKRVLITIVFITVTASCCLAQEYMELFPGNTRTYEGVKSNGMMLLSQGQDENENNADIRGNPFWSEDWKEAFLYTDNFKILVPKVKLNLYKDNVFYTTPDSLVMIAKEGMVKGITFFNGDDTTSILANFVYLKKEDDKNYHYYQVMNFGKAQLVKQYNVTLFKPPLDPTTGRIDWHYVTKDVTYIYFKGKLKSLKGNNKDAIFSILNPDASCVDWLTKHDNKLKSSADILDFLSYFSRQDNK